MTLTGFDCEAETWSETLNVYLKTFGKLQAELNALIQGSKFGSHCNLEIEIILEYQNSEERMFSA